MNWQPIDTAPRDGTRVLLRFERSEEVVVGGYDVHIRIRNGVEVSRSEGWCLGEHRSGQPACWAPLPVSPAGALSPMQQSYFNNPIVKPRGDFGVLDAPVSASGGDLKNNDAVVLIDRPDLSAHA